MIWKIELVRSFVAWKNLKEIQKEGREDSDCILGRPNVGKSTIIECFVWEKMVVVSEVRYHSRLHEIPFEYKDIPFHSLIPPESVVVGKLRKA